MPDESDQIRAARSPSNASPDRAPRIGHNQPAVHDPVPAPFEHNQALPPLNGTTPVPFEPWFDSRFRKPDGGLYSKRQRRHIVERYRLPIIKIGWTRLIVPADGDTQIAKFARFRDQPEQPWQPRRGRPRTYRT